MDPRIIIEATSEEAVSVAVRQVRESKGTLVPVGAGTHGGGGEPGALRLNMQPMNRIKAYEPDDLVVTAEAGTTLGELQKVLRVHDQWLPIEGSVLPGSTIGGIVASGVQGESAARYGSTRDMLLSARVVLADGVAVHSGSGVVKSVAGYDLHKVFIGSRGTLGVITELTFRVAPCPERQLWLCLPIPDPPDALRLSESLAICTPACAIAVSPSLAARIGLGLGSVLLSRFDGFAEDTTWQSEEWKRRWKGAFVPTSPQVGPVVQVHDVARAWPDAVRTHTELADWHRVVAATPVDSWYDFFAGVAYLPDRPVALAKSAGEAIFKRTLYAMQPSARSLQERLKSHFDPHALFPQWLYA
jgi:FAD/FMN-containing dehydrogenase